MATDISTDLNDYGFSTSLRVRLSETDAVGIVFFGSFATFFDVGRMDYLENLGVSDFRGVIPELIPGVVIHHESRFHTPARYADTLIVHVRIAELGNTSYTFHFLGTKKKTREVVVTGALTLCWLDDAQQPTRIPQAFRDAVVGFEADRVTQRV